jgi:hypothetical protein
LKVAFNILPVITEYEQVHLLVEAGTYGISFVWFTKDPYDVRGIAVYNLTDKALPGEMADNISGILQAAPIFKKNYASVTICYDFKESLLVPETFYDAGSAEAMLNLIYASGSESNCKTEAAKDNRFVVVYAVYKKIEEILAAYFPNAEVHHATRFQLEKMYSDDNVMYCIFFHNSIKVLLFNNGSLQLVQQFSYNQPVDASYHLLNCCEQYDSKPSEIRLVLSGMIDEKSKLYSEIYKYFLNIEFEKPDDNISLHDRIKFYPPHFFSHITGLALCVS